MSSASKRTVVAAISLTALVSLGACSSETAGQPTSQKTGSEASTVESTSEQASPDYPLARLCELISPDEAQELGGAPEGEKGYALSDGHAICQWADATSLIVGFQAGTSTAQADTGPTITNTPTTIGWPAVQALNTNTVVLCEILVDLPSGKLVAAGATVLSAGEGRYDPCQVANQLANLIIPRVKDQ